MVSTLGEAVRCSLLLAPAGMALAGLMFFLASRSIETDEAAALA